MNDIDANKTWDLYYADRIGEWEFKIPLKIHHDNYFELVINILRKIFKSLESYIRPLYIEVSIGKGRLNKNRIEFQGSEHREFYLDEHTPQLKIIELLQNVQQEFMDKYPRDIIYLSNFDIYGQTNNLFVDSHQKIMNRWIPDLNDINHLTASSHTPKYSYVISMEFDEIRPTFILLWFSTYCSIWGYTTPEGNNTMLAELNNPRLSFILHELEKQLEVEISLWSGENYMKIGRYGFDK